MVRPQTDAVESRSQFENVGWFVNKAWFGNVGWFGSEEWFEIETQEGHTEKPHSHYGIQNQTLPPAHTGVRTQVVRLGYETVHSSLECFLLLWTSNKYRLYTKVKVSMALIIPSDEPMSLSAAIFPEK